MKSGSVPCVSYDAGFSGNATFAIDLGADLTFSYDRADIVPGGAVPIQVTYTPTNDPTHEVTVNAAADVSLSTESPLSVLAPCAPASAERPPVEPQARARSCGFAPTTAPPPRRPTREGRHRRSESAGVGARGGLRVGRRGLRGAPTPRTLSGGGGAPPAHRRA